MVQMNLYTGQEQRCRHRDGQTRVRGNGADGINCEIGINIYTLPCVKQMSSVNQVYSIGSSVSALSDLKGWDGGGRQWEGGPG